MVNHSASLKRLIEALHELPGIGPKSAERLAFYLLRATKDEVFNLAEAMKEVKEKIQYCPICFNICETTPCPICQDISRDQSTICVVEEPQDIVALEKTGQFKGLYHVLLGVLNPLDGVGPDDLKIRELLTRIEKGNIKEIIVATNPNVEGEATAIYLARLIKPLGIKVTRIAYGLPIGGDLEYADEVTLAKALEGRKEL